MLSRLSVEIIENAILPHLSFVDSAAFLLTEKAATEFFTTRSVQTLFANRQSALKQQLSQLAHPQQIKLAKQDEDAALVLLKLIKESPGSYPTEAKLKEPRHSITARNEAFAAKREKPHYSLVELASVHPSVCRYILKNLANKVSPEQLDQLKQVHETQSKTLKNN